MRLDTGAEGRSFRGAPGTHRSYMGPPGTFRWRWGRRVSDLLVRIDEEGDSDGTEDHDGTEEHDGKDLVLMICQDLGLFESDSSAGGP